MSKTLILYSSTDGHTKTICERIARGLDSDVRLFPVDQPPALAEFDKIVIGASIRYGHHSPATCQFIANNTDVLNAKTSALFSVNLTARKPNKNTPQTNPYLKKFIKKIKWYPDLIEVFAGRVNYPKYKIFDRVMIQFIMFLTHGPTDPTQVIDYTDWDKVDDFARRVDAL